MRGLFVVLKGSLKNNLPPSSVQSDLNQLGLTINFWKIFTHLPGLSDENALAVASLWKSYFSELVSASLSQVIFMARPTSLYAYRVFKLTKLLIWTGNSGSLPAVTSSVRQVCKPIVRCLSYLSRLAALISSWSWYFVLLEMDLMTMFFLSLLFHK